MTKMGSMGLWEASGTYQAKINPSTPPGMAVLRGFVGSTTVSGLAAPAPISLPAPAFII